MSSYLLYGGTPGGGANSGGVLLSRLQVLAYQRQPVWNGPARIGVMHRLHVRGIFNPEVNAYSIVGGFPATTMPAVNLAGLGVADAGGRTRDALPALSMASGAGLAGAGGRSGAIPGTSRGAFAPLTDLAIRDALMTPRKQLVFMVGTAAVLVSPTASASSSVYTTDADNGPLPLSCDVVRISGTKTFAVDFAIQTTVNDSSVFSDSPSVLTSNVYSALSNIDQDGFEMRTYQGVATFRADRLTALGAAADDFRSYLFIPVPDGFKRNMHEWFVDVSGNTLRYSFTDHQQALCIKDPNVSRIECFDEADSSVQGSEAIAGDVIGDVADAVKGLFKGEVPSIMPLVKTALRAVPTIVRSTVVRVWGYPQSNRSQLQRTAMRVLLLRNALMTQLSKKGLTPTMSMKITHDVMGRFVELRATFRWGPVVQLSGLFWDPAKIFPADDNLSPVATYAPSACPALPNDGGARSTYLRQLAVAALIGPHTTPPAPTLPSTRTVRTPP